MAGLKATVEDVRHAYRLLLGREPDEEGAQTFHRMIAERAPSPPDLARHFLGSQEFVALESIALAEVELGDFIMVVRSDDEAVGQAIRDTRQWEPHVTSELRSRLHEGAAFLGSIALRVEGALLDRSLCGSVAGWNLSSRRLWA